MTGMPWVKLYKEILDDVKISRLSDSQKWRFIQLILFAAECDAEGALVTGESPVTHDDISVRLRCDSEELKKDIQKMLGLGLLQWEDEVLVIVSFSDRQGPTQEEKRKKWRERQRERRERVNKMSSKSHPRVSPLDIEEESRVDQDLTKGAGAPVPTNLDGWLIEVKESNNRNATLMVMFNALYPSATECPDYGYLGKTANVVGGAGRMAALMWECSSKKITGDVMRYIQAYSKNSNHQEEEEIDMEEVREKEAKETRERIAKLRAKNG